ncbi:MAG: 30S ribosomal protein S6 [Clostridia bacterium]|jgi:small subunit ribosomal protein S6|nr:30S ribosomal protein S6 [Clostridia bacterium]
MNNYELALVINPTISEEEVKATVEKVKSLITRAGGEITNVDEWGKRKLAYEIEKLREGFYFFITYTANVDAPAEIERDVKIMEKVMRYMTVKEEK